MNDGAHFHKNDPETSTLRVMTCVKCGDRHTVDISSILAELREKLATAICSTFDMDNHDHEAFLQPDYCEAGLKDADQLLPYLK